MPTLDHQLEDIQVRLTFLDDAVGGLTAADTALVRRLNAIERHLEALRADVASLRADSDHDPGEEPPPPHY